MRFQTIGRLLYYFMISSSLAHSYQAPSAFLSGTASFMSRGLQNSCYAFDVPADTLPCNPAFIAKEKNRRFNANLYLGNNVSYLKEAMDLSQGHADEDSIQALFKRHENNELQTQIELGNAQETFGWSVTPLLVNYNTSFRNQALPQISLFASLEESARVQFGSYISDDWSFGIQLRYLHRRFIASQFFLTDALIPAGHYLFEPKQQNIFFLEPAILYAPSDNSLNPEFTAIIANAGLINQSYDEIPVTPEFHITSSITPKLKYGRYSLGFDINFDKTVHQGSGPFTLGGFYEYGILRLFGSLARSSNGVGFGVFNAWWNIGLAYRGETYEDALGEVITQNKSYLFLGMEL